MCKVFSKIQLIKYFFLQNRYSWRGLSSVQKQIILNANLVHNNIREDYSNPEKYLNGQIYQSNVDRNNFFRGRMVNYFCKKHSFNSVLEIGPGGGFYTKNILNSRGVKSYTAVDIVQSFLTYVEREIASDNKKHIKCKYFNGSIPKDDKYDVIFILSTLHHIPDREDYLNSLADVCHKDTMIVCVEPTHYLIRILKILLKIRLYISKKYISFNNYQNLSTHHFLTLGEFNSFKKYNIEEFNFGFTGKVRKILNINQSKNKFLKYFSTEMYVVLKPKSEFIEI